MLLNYETYAFNFNNSCLEEGGLQFLESRDFKTHANISRGYINSDSLISFIQQISGNGETLSCIIDIEFDFLVQTEKCGSENISSVLYGNISKPAPWNLDMLDEIVDNKYDFEEKELEDIVDIWILDTGVNKNHLEFEINQVIDEDPTFTVKNITNNHGTGTGSCASGKNYGSSKNFTIHNYPVCRSGGSCSNSDVDKGFNLVLEHVKARNSTGKRSVINLSIGSSVGSNPENTSLGKYFNSLFKSITDFGGIIVVAAGNSNQDACTWYYSYSPYVISVGSIGKLYTKSSFSNYGECVDIYNFGENIPMAYSFQNNDTVQYKSGTSFSCPLTSGVIANLLYHTPTLNKQEILDIMFDSINNLAVVSYTCKGSDGPPFKKCCRGGEEGTRLDEFCKTQLLKNCKRNCQIKSCKI